MGLTLRQLNRATLARQMLLRRERLDVADAVHRVVALQAQDPVSPYIALWNRVTDFSPGDLDRAFAAHAVLKATLMRVTLHAVAAADHPTVHAAMVPILRAARLGRRFAATGLTEADLDRLIPEVVAFAAEPRSKAEIEGLVASRIGAAPAPDVWRALRSIAPLVHTPTGVAWSFGPRTTYLAAPTVPSEDGPELALQRLAWHYLEGFGPASVGDFARFALQYRPTARAAIAALADKLVTYEGPDGAPLVDVPGAPLPNEDTPAPPRLLGMWDSVLLAFDDRRRVIDDEHRQLVMRRNGDILPTLLVDGRVAGVWQPTDDGIAAHAFQPLSDDVWSALTTEARALRPLLSPTPYARQAHWFTDLPTTPVTLALA